ncbi:MAG: hypothetical protein LBI03_08110 [Clostridiales bacterium]|jgi:hypothetical protein|nr:hypothetical protein [Clostridiales bacterium]
MKRRRTLYIFLAIFMVITGTVLGLYLGIAYREKVDSSKPRNIVLEELFDNQAQVIIQERIKARIQNECEVICDYKLLQEKYPDIIDLDQVDKYDYSFEIKVFGSDINYDEYKELAWQVKCAVIDDGGFSPDDMHIFYYRNSEIQYESDLSSVYLNMSEDAFKKSTVHKKVILTPEEEKELTLYNCLKSIYAIVIILMIIGLITALIIKKRKKRYGRIG